MAGNKTVQRGFNINEFKSKVGQFGLIKPSSFMVEITFGADFGLLPYDQKFSGMRNNLQFMAEATNLPGVSLATTEIRRHGYGVIEKKPYVPIFTDINMVFRSDANGDLYTFFQTWMKMIINFDGRASINSVTGVLPKQGMYEVAYKKNYMSTVTIHLMNATGQEPIEIVLVEAYPIFLGEVPLAWQSQNDYVKIPIKLTFRDWFLENKQFVAADNLTQNNLPRQPFGPPVSS